MHILPRVEVAANNDNTTAETNHDQIHAEVEAWAPRPALQVPASELLQVPADAERRDRTSQEMADEAAVYRKIVEEMS